MTEQLKLDRVSVHYGDFEAAHKVSLSLPKGQIGCLLGPSGCGKTTLLRAIAGFEPLSSGEISLGQQLISSPQLTLAPELRRVGMVFQDFALFPHLNVQRNVGFGLQQLPMNERRQRVTDMLQLVGLSSSAEAWPHELSGGQQQRIALARALAPAPELLLLDEPFSGLDSELREALAGEVRELLGRNGTTAILVTHDQHEAFAMADQITLLEAGRIAQSGTPQALYHRPANEFVAGFIGQGTLITVSVNEQGEISNGLGGLDVKRSEPLVPGAVKILIRPEDVRYAPDSELQLTVVNKSFRGAQTFCQLALADGQSIPCLTPSHIEINRGEQLPVTVDLQKAVVFQQG